MIKPTKYTNINLSVIGLSAEIIKVLQSDSVQKYNQLLDRIIYKKGEEAKENFLLALGFLFLLGKIKYYKQEDVIQLLSLGEREVN